MQNNGHLMKNMWREFCKYFYLFIFIFAHNQLEITHSACRNKDCE